MKMQKAIERIRQVCLAATVGVTDRKLFIYTVTVQTAAMKQAVTEAARPYKVEFVVTGKVRPAVAE
jgi:hypothetical protein